MRVFAGLPAEPLAVDPVAQEGELFELGLALGDDFFEAILFEQTLLVRVLAHVSEVVGTVDQFGMVEVDEFEGGEALGVFFDIGF